VERKRKEVICKMICRFWNMIRTAVERIGYVF
jgi:hypothetical protein